MSKDLKMHKRHRIFGSDRRPEAGFSMIEVMVALFVTSIGLLGLAALQMTSLRFSHNTQARSQATFLARDVIEQMRAQSISAMDESFDTTGWKTEVESLPEGEGTVKVENGIVQVEIEWGEQDGKQTFNYAAPL